MVLELKQHIHLNQEGGKGNLAHHELKHNNQNHLASILRSFKEGYTSIFNERAKLSYVASRRIPTTPYHTFLYQKKLDDLKILMEELESEISKTLYSNLEELVDELLSLAVTKHLERSKSKRPELPDVPVTEREIRTILYRMYRGGSFYPLVFTRDVESEFFRVLARKTSAQGMRGKEIADRTRKFVLRLRYDLKETIHKALEDSELLEPIGFVRWTWRRGKVVRRAAYAPADLQGESRRVAGILERAIRRRQVVTRRIRTGRH